MKATIVKIGPTYQMRGECDICKGREGRRYDATFTFDCGGTLKGITCSPCWKKHAPGQVVDLQNVGEHVHLNDGKRVYESIGQVRRLFEQHAQDARLIGEPGGTEYELVQPEVRARVYRHYGDEPCPWKPAPLPEPVTEQLLTVVKSTLGYLAALSAGVYVRPNEDTLKALREVVARAERR
jgi:hypothetical protein